MPGSRIGPQASPFLREGFGPRATDSGPRLLSLCLLPRFLHTWVPRSPAARAPHPACSTAVSSDVFCARQSAGGLGHPMEASSIPHALLWANLVKLNCSWMHQDLSLDCLRDPWCLSLGRWDCSPGLQEAWMWGAGLLSWAQMNTFSAHAIAMQFCVWVLVLAMCSGLESHVRWLSKKAEQVLAVSWDLSSLQVLTSTLLWEEKVQLKLAVGFFSHQIVETPQRGS